MTRPARVRPTRTRKPRVTTLPQLLATAVEADPSGIAVVYADATATLAELTYAELDERSTRLARLLIDRGIGPEDLVAIGIPRSLESVIAVWAVAKTGAGFVPVDPNYPADRVAHMVSDSRAVVGLTVAAVRADLPGEVEWLAIDAAELAGRLEEFPADPVTYADRLRPLRAEHPAYVIYTSGSTGRPKGVVVTQAGLSSFCDEQRERYRVDSESRTLHFASPSFDASVLELLLAIGGAATMVVAAPSVYGGDELAALLAREEVTHAFITPAALASVDPAGLDELRVVVAGGEACPPELVRRWVIPIGSTGREREFYNGYGPTETTIMTNISAPLVPGEPVTIGGPIRAVTEFVLDERLAPVPSGAVGELYICAAQVARGYHARPALTAARFVANPFDPTGSRLYRTGDLVRWTANGELEYLGRNDFQVKIRGFRIELGEIDAVLAAHDAVDFAVTVGHKLDSGATILAAYVHAAPGAAIDVAELTAHAERSLPAHMVPTSITVLDAIPLTPVGKLDRAALPAPVLQTRRFRAPEGRLEQLVAGLFTELLGPDAPIGADDDFFELGGNSLIATQVAARLGALISARVPARLLFEAPTVAALAARLESVEGEGNRLPLTAMPRPELIPLSLAQQRMWFLNRFDPESAADNIPFAIRLTGYLDIEALADAILDVIDRHETLRTVYPAVDGTGYQEILPLEQAIPDLAPKTLREDEIEGWITEFALTGFDVTAEVPLRIGLAELAPDDHVIAVVVHHIAADGASVTPFMRDLLAAFLARRNGATPAWTPLPVQYADYALWQRAVLGEESDPESVAAAQIAYWRAALDGLPDRLDLPADRPRPAVASGRGAEYRFAVDAELGKRLEELAQGSGASLFMVVHAALAALLARLSATDDIAIGTPVAGRGERELDGLIGMFVNTLVLRTRIDGAASFAELLAQVKQTDLGAFSHAELPFERLVEVLDPVRSQAHHPLFQVALFFQNMDRARLELPGLSATAVEFSGAVAKFDLQLTMVPQAEGLSGLFTYAVDLFDEATVAGFADRLLRLLEGVTAEPDRALGDIDLLRPDERVAILYDWNDTRYPVEPELLLDGYRRAVEQFPDVIALSYENSTLTYAEFDERVNQLARLLISRGVGPETLVGLAIRRSLDLVVGMYAIVAAGGAYVPLDPDHPVERIAHILDTARPVVVVTTVADSVAVPIETPVLRLDTMDLSRFDPSPIRPEERNRPLRPEHPAYVIFTSGSTGRPKGVAISHAAIHNQITWMLAAYPLGTGDVYLQKTATTFDVSLWGYFMPLRAGAKLVVATHDGHRDPVYVAETIAAQGVTVTDFVPSMLTVFATHTAPGACPSLQDVLVIGEALPPETVDALHRVSPARVHNLYGPTEAAVSVTYWPAWGEDRPSVPIGLPQWNTQVYVLDARLRPVPAGVPGELYLAGDQLARGYVRRPDLTADRFVANPFGDGTRMYRTGDLVVWRAAAGDLPARLDYLGRTDFQVKFRGQRIELGEIETALLAQPSVSQAVALVVSSPLGDQLVAYAVPAPDKRIDAERLRAAVSDTLPAYMIPATIVALDAFPLNASGKLDRRALPAPVWQTREFRAPATPVEEIVAEIFGEVLGIERVGADDDFFALGGNSLVATQVVARLGAAIGARVPVRALFETPTVAELAATVESQAHLDRSVELGSLERPDELPLSLAQQRMWFLNRFDQADGGTASGSAAYNLPFALRLTGSLDAESLTAALDDVVARHEVLRTIYPETPAGPVQVVLPPDTRLGVTVEQVASDEVAAAVHELAATPFDVTSEVPVRVRLLRLSDLPPGSRREYVLAVVVHHIAADGSSMGPLVRDVMTAYAARTSGQAPAWPPLRVQYADYALWQRAVLGDENDPRSIAAQQIAYWRRELADLPDLLELPTDRPRPPVASLAGARVGIEIDAATHAGLVELAHAQGATVFMVVHTALAVLLARLSGSDDIAIGTPVAGRGEAELDDLIGMFVNTVVFRTRLDRGESFADLLARQRETDLQAFAHADIPFERLVEVLNPRRSTAHHPLFQVGLSFQNLARTQLELPGLSMQSVDADLDVSQFDLHLIVADAYAEDGTPAGIGGFLTYATDLFDVGTVEEFAERLDQLLTAVVADATAPVGDIDLLTAAERERALVSRNDTAHPVDHTATLVTLLDRSVAADPAAVALVADLPDTAAGRLELSYGELDARVNRLARHLISLGVGPEDRVALALRRSADLVVAMYAVAKAGGVYVPLDPDQPVERIRYILSAADPVVVLTDSGIAAAAGISGERAASDATPEPSASPAGRGHTLDWRGRRDSIPTRGEPARLPVARRTSDIFTGIAVPLVRVDELDLSHFSAEPVTDADRRAPLRPENTAYVIFTSGSTGRPKGVAVPHAAVVNQLLWKTDEFDLGPADSILLKTAATFDLSVWEFWSAAVCGGRLVIATADGHRDPVYLHQLMARERVTTLHAVPSLLDALLTVDGGATPLRRVLAIGEALPAALARRFRTAHPETALFNLYGPTEAAVSITSHEVSDADSVSVPIGMPEWNSQVYVLDSRLRPVPDGVCGELYLAGAQLARGYFGRPDLTAERFVANPFGETGAGSGGGSRMYRTGDLVAWRGGELEYRGRTDFQVKVRGFRIELGEIEAALLALPQVAQAVVLARTDSRTGDRLVAYLVPSSSEVDVARVKSALSMALPSYMVPAAFVVLEALPLNANGKLDRKALPEPEFESTEFRAPSTPIEEVVASVYADVLGVDRVGADDDFFALGGNSLLATQVAARIGAALDTRVPVRALFEAPTVATLAVKVERGTGETARTPLTAGPRPQTLPLSFAQQRMWFLNQFDTTASVYNIPVAIRLSGALDAAALREAVADLVARHEILRTIYPNTPDGPVQRVLSPADVPIDLEPVSIGEERVAHEVGDLVGAGFDVAAEIPFRIRLFRLAATEYVLVFVAHHIAADGWSMGPLTRDLMVAYVARSTGEAPAWAPLPIQYADFALWQRSVLGDENDPESIAGSQLAYWTTELADLPDEITLPADRPRPPAQSFAGGKTDFVVDAEVHRALAELARAHNATLFMVVHTALSVFLARLSGTDDIAIGTPIAGRGEAELDDLIGMFVNTLVLRTRVAPGSRFTELLAANRETDLRAFAHADIPFERLVEALDPARSAARHPLFQVALSFENLAATGFELPGLNFTALDPAVDTAKFDLLLTVREQRAADGSEAGLAAEFTYARDLFDEATVEEFGRRFRRLLAAVAADPATTAGDLELLDDSERADLVARTGAPAVPPRTLPELMAAAVEANPDGPAVVFRGRSYTYTQLDIASSKLARRLIQLGAGPDVLVAVAIPRSIEALVTLWSVTKSGAAFVPIDPTYPADRIAHMVADSRASLGVTLRSVVADLPEVSGGWVVLDTPEFAYDVDALSGEPVTDDERPAALRPDNAAYVIYTSGSTGLPKGVVMSHAGLANFSAEQVERYGLDRTSRALAFASPSFDASVLEVLLAIGAGGALVLVPPRTFGGEELSELIQRERVTHAFLTPLVLASLDPAALADMRAIAVGGEAVPADLVAKWGGSADGSGRRFHNIYGPTETTMVTTISEPLSPGDPITIGGPNRGVRALVLDSRLRPVPEGVAGELYLGGIQLARGYHDRPGLTAARFVADPFGNIAGTPGSRLYRTGDVVRWRRGEPVLEYVGRNDFQVKVRGFRIELGEIDAALTRLPGVDFAATLGRETDAGATILVSYVHPAPGAELDTAALTEELGRTLPDYMVPTAIVVLERIPLTPVGKLDRKALPEPVLETKQYRAPRTEAEHVVAEVIGEVLGVDRIGLDDDFFALGGDSIVSVQVVARARGRGVHFTPRDVFECRTVEALARAAAREPAVAAPVEPSGPLPLPPRAVRLLQIDPAARDNRAIALDIPSDCAPERVRAAVEAVLERHPMLSARLEAAARQDDSSATDPSTRLLPVRREAVAPDAAAARTELLPVGGAPDPEAAEEFETEWAEAKTQILPVAVVDHETRFLPLPPALNRDPAAPVGWLDADAAGEATGPADELHLVLPDEPAEALLRQFVPTAEGAEVALRALTAELDPFAGRNIGFGLIAPTERDAAAPGTLIVVANGIVVDDASWRVVVDELSAAWSGGHAAAAAADGGPAEVARTLAARATAPATLDELSWWRDALVQAPADLPVAGLDPAARGRVSLVITAEGAAAVGAVARAYHASIEDVLVTALALALRPPLRGAAAELLGPVVQLAADGRAVAGLESGGTVGGFTATFPLVLGLDEVNVDEALVGGPAAGRALAQIKELRRSVPDHGVGYGLLRYLNPETAAELADLPHGRTALRYRDLRPAHAYPDTSAADLLLDLTVDATEDGLLARFDYAAAVLDVEQVKEFAGHWVRALGGLAEHGTRSDAGGFTPSDFPLVRLAQADVDRLQRDHPALVDVWPLTPLQSGMLFHALLADASVDVYTTQFSLDLTGAVDERRLREAAQGVLDRHDNLRVAFAEDAAGRPVQVVLDPVEVPWRAIDLSHMGPTAAAAELARLEAADYADRFDMGTAPLLRFALIRTAPEAYRLLVTSHHILIDGWSMPLLMQDLLTLYALGPRSRHLPAVHSYGDYLAWLVAQDPEAARTAWRAALAGITEPTPLAPVDPGREIASGVGEVGFELSAADTTALTRLAARLGVTVNTVVQAAWGLLIGRSVDRDDVVFGATVSGRPPQLPGVETMVGLFLNAIPVRVRLRPTDTLAGLLRQLQSEQAALLDHHHLGLSDIQETVGVEGLFDSLVVFESFPIDREGLDRASAIDGMHVSGVGAVNGTHYPVTVMVVLDNQLRVSLKYLRDVFDESAAQALAQRLSNLIGRFTSTPQARVAEVDALLDAERAELAARNFTAAPELLDDATLLTLFDAQVARTPHAPAVHFGDTTLTYRELDERSRALAAELIARGVGPEALVAVAMRRSIELIVAIYAVLRAGGGYVPVDPDHPAERNEFVLGNADPVCVLTTARDGFRTATGVPIVAVDELELPEPVAAEPNTHADAVAYVIHTSGSTGRPKGVVITHRQMVNQFRWAQLTHPHDTGDVVLHKTPITFDISTWELFWPLQTGAAVVIAEPDGHRDPAYLARVIERRSVSTVHFVPSMLDAFLDPVANPAVAQGLPSLRRVFAAGEALAGETAAAFAALFEHAELVNWYGPAEATVVTDHPVRQARSGAVPIGVPVANTRVHVLDRQLRPVPPGAPGELYVAGVQLARGYLGAPALTAERFVATEGGRRLYRTGDVVRWRDGVLEYLGRSDFQVKLRGQRIELGEIESVLSEHDSVRHAVVSLLRGDSGDRLVAYLVPRPDREIDEAAVLTHARESLPGYMIPAAVVVLAELPLNASGKLDRKALPAPRSARRPYRAPATPLEQTIAEVFAEVLGVDRVGLDDDFFALGGNSLIATRAVSRLRTVTGAEVRVQWFFTGATVAALAERVLAALAQEHEFDQDSDAALAVLLPIRTDGPGEPLFCIHPMYGLSWCYAGLARYVADRPVLGLQSPALSEDGYLPQSLAELAARYVEEIRAVQPHGPYRLLGWSLGGVLAHAIATRLQAAGERVALLAMLDSHPDIEVADFRTAIRDALAEIGIGAEALVGDGDIHDLSDEAVAALHATIPPDMAVLTPERVRRIYRSAVRSAELIAEHTPAVFHGRLDYFSALGHDAAARNWRDYVDGEIADHPIAATHDQMTSPEALADLGPKLARLLLVENESADDGMIGRASRNKIDSQDD
ncbi:amino acid adenylation domain-containing protein [Nocardia sp. CDC141]|uniref:Amino acid adenylation domain-containing protein n=1 Tax=Nocardia pulmonis TaxID=2951408 RepID=A0A9X2IZF3_9NOCA|nr:non-ribosomal peptide synthetase [Nocardia pulmonis]MCM6775975.1 amino acid adenylation domain-containing protein [Nocardia pulmonis]